MREISVFVDESGDYVFLTKTTGGFEADFWRNRIIIGLTC